MGVVFVGCRNISNDFDQKEFDQYVWRVFLRQLFLSFIISLSVGLYFVVISKSKHFIDWVYLYNLQKSTGYGSVLGIVHTLLTALNITLSTRTLVFFPKVTVISIYIGLLNRLIVIGGGISLGLVYFDLNPFLFIASYLFVQTAFCRTKPASIGSYQ